VTREDRRNPVRERSADARPAADCSDRSAPRRGARGAPAWARRRLRRRPSRRDAEAALELLLGIVAEFSFADDTSKVVAISAKITALVRRSLRAASLFAYTAPKMASGKTLLATIDSYLATGRPPAMPSQAEDAGSGSGAGKMCH
jgi:hypothetical protein